ncbi:hypothetical protein [Sphingomonas sp. PB4P5]|uniref:hypothetical protein n=1 Tax=Parasphingomonas puruogangriensis TaxID=3096155 RepID=UPI002FC8664C
MKRTGTEPSTADVARAMLAARQAMQQHLPVELLHDPSVDMLLSLFVAEADGVSMGAAELATTTTVGPATALRWIKAMTAMELIAARGEIIALTTSGRDAVAATLDAVTRAQAADNHVQRPRLRMLFGRDQALVRPAAPEPTPRVKIG